MATIYANALLSDGKILFWKTGQSRKQVNDFYKDFYIFDMDFQEYKKNHKLEVKTMGFEFDDEYSINNYVFETITKSFYKYWPISPDYKGEPAYVY